MLAPASIDKSACSSAGIMSPGLGPAELLRNCLLDWAPSGANKKWPPRLGPGSFLKKLQWGAVFLCQIEYGCTTQSTGVERHGKLIVCVDGKKYAHRCRYLIGEFSHVTQ